jgi:hypothetical protein
MKSFLPQRQLTLDWFIPCGKFHRHAISIESIAGTIYTFRPLSL